MNAPLDQYELYRVITDYEALVDGFSDRIEDLDAALEQIDEVAGMTRGYAQKLLARNPGKRVQEPRDGRFAQLKRKFGWESLGKMLKGTGLALVLVVDDERFAPLKEQLSKRKRQRKPTNVSMRQPGWLFTKRNAANMRALGVQSLSPQQRKRIAKRAAKARWRKQKRGANVTASEMPKNLRPYLSACARSQLSRALKVPLPVSDLLECPAPNGA